MSIISYAQNFEDVMLWRALGHIERGFYIDIGAQHPIIDSVSKAFYEHGWRGIHVEPTSTYADLLRQQRPDESVIQAAVSNLRGKVKLYEIPGGGLSTGIKSIAHDYEQRGITVQEILVPSITLDDIFDKVEKREIHWLKIDVEGMESQVLEGWKHHEARPWVIVIESTIPCSPEENWEIWESLLLKKGYRFVYFDGLNRFYLSLEHKDIVQAFRVPPNVFDGFSVDGSASSSLCQYLNSKFNKNKAELQQKIENIQLELQAAIINGEQSSQQHVTRIQELQGRIEAERAENQLRKAEWFEKEKILISLGQQNRDEVHRQAQAHLRELIERDRAAMEQLDALRQALAEQAERETKAHKAREQTLHEQLEEASAEIERLHDEWAIREKTLIAEREQARNEARIQEKARQRELHAAHIVDIQLRSEIDQAINVQHQLNDQLVIERENCLKLQQARTATQIELDALRNDLSWRITAPLRAIAGWFRSTPKLIWPLGHTAEQLVDEPISYAEQGTSTDSIQKFTPNGTFSETTMKSEHSAQATQPTPATQINAAPNLRTLLQYQDGQFIECAYLTLLKRAPDSIGFNYYLDRLRNGVTKLHILGQLVASPEARKGGGKPSGLQIAVWLNKYAMFPQFLISMIFNSADMSVRARNIKNINSSIIHLSELEECGGGDFVENCYLKLLHRQADSSGKDYYLMRLHAGDHKAEIIDCIVNSDEGRKLGVKVLGLRRKRLIQNFMALPFVGALASVFLHLFNVRSYARAIRRLENQSEIRDITDASFNAMSSAVSFMRETQRRLNDVEALVQKSQTTNENYKFQELVSNLVTSYPIANRENARALYEYKSQMDLMLAQSESYRLDQETSTNIVDADLLQASNNRRATKHIQKAT